MILYPPDAGHYQLFISGEIKIGLYRGNSVSCTLFCFFYEVRIPKITYENRKNITSPKNQNFLSWLKILENVVRTKNHRKSNRANGMTGFSRDILIKLDIFSKMYKFPGMRLGFDILIRYFQNFPNHLIDFFKSLC